MGYLGFWVLCEGISPIKEAIEAVVNIQLRDSKGVCLIMGLIN